MTATCWFLRMPAAAVVVVVVVWQENINIFASGHGSSSVRFQRTSWQSAHGLYFRRNGPVITESQSRDVWVEWYGWETRACEQFLWSVWWRRWWWGQTAQLRSDSFSQSVSCSKMVLCAIVTVPRNRAECGESEIQIICDRMLRYASDTRTRIMCLCEGHGLQS